jgi:(R,R)-butanediol dehydrogenase/meso-butanediol dehydrogenase/diacetyl reductase
MTETMMAAVYHGKNDIRLATVPVPTPRAGELLLRVGTVGVCGSDVGEWAFGPKQHPLTVPHPVTGYVGPIIPGHEFSGTVVGLGEGVDDAWLNARVASCGSVACGTCDACRRGQSNQCSQYHGVGLHRPGALAEYVTTPAANCAIIDGLGISLDEAALCQPMAIAVHNVARAGDVTGLTVLVQGVGGIGAFLVFALVAAGADVVATDIDPERLAIATELGAREVVQVSGAATDAQAIRAAIGERELRVFFEVSGSRSGIQTAFDLSPRGCRIVLVGIQKAPVEVDLARLTLEENTLIGTNALVREHDFPRAVELIASRRGRWGILAPRVLPMTSIVEEVLKPMSEGRATAIKTLIDPLATHVRTIRSERK